MGYRDTDEWRKLRSDLARAIDPQAAEAADTGQPDAEATRRHAAAMTTARVSLGLAAYLATTDLRNDLRRGCLAAAHYTIDQAIAFTSGVLATLGAAYAMGWVSC